MKPWEFLIQKKGSTAWLALKTQKLKLEAGEYRLVARSHRPNLEVEVLVTYQTLEKLLARPRSQKRTTRTNPEGLLPVFPFVNLKPGLWQVCCLEQTSEETAPQIVRLQVLPAVIPAAPEPPLAEESEEEVTSQPVEFDPAAPLSLSEAALDPAADLESLLERSIQSLEQILEAASQPVAKSASVPLETPPAAKMAVEVGVPDEIAALQLRLTLYHENFVRHPGEALLVSGQVDAIDPTRNDLEPLFAALEGRSVQLVLRYLLRNPQTPAPGENAKETEAAGLQILYDSQQPGASTALPKVFGYRLEVPERYHHPLILGEARLEVVLGTALQTTRTLAQSSFVISAAVDELLEVAFPPQSEPERAATQLPELEEIPALGTEFVEIAKQPPPTPTYSPVSGQILPPKLSSPTSKAARGLDLPDFGIPLPSTPPEPPAEPPAETPAAESQPEDVPAPPPSPSLGSEFPNLDDLLLPLPEELEAEPPPEPAPPEPPSEPSEAERAFQALHLEDRFWSRMNSLVEESGTFAETPPPPPSTAEPEAGLAPPQLPVAPVSAVEADKELVPRPAEADGIAAEEGSPVAPSLDVFEEDPWENLLVESAAPEGPLPPEPGQFVELGPAPLEELPSPPETSVAVEDVVDWEQPEPEMTDWALHEIVVDDEDEMPPPELFKRDTSGLPYPSVANSMPALPQERKKVNRDSEEPLPVPILEVSEGELVAGETILVWVKLPPRTDSIYVKLWVLDCQTRSLLDGPRAFVDFTENQDGEWETITQLLVPLGSLEIRLEAIAIDIVTQRESHKASISRHVIPADFPQSFE